MTPDELAELLSNIRKGQGQSIPAIAKASGLNTSLIYMIEARKRQNPSWDTVRRIVTALGYKIEITKVEP